MTTPALSQRDPSSTRAAFAEIICQDDEWIEAEFAAITAAEWACSPPVTVTFVQASTLDRQPLVAGRSTDHPSISTESGRRGGRSRSRQRSPPERRAAVACSGRPRRSTPPGPHCSAR